MHGFVHLELGGHLGPLAVPVDALFAAEIESALAMIVANGPDGRD